MEGMESGIQQVFNASYGRIMFISIINFACALFRNISEKSIVCRMIIVPLGRRLWRG